MIMDEGAPTGTTYVYVCICIYTENRACGCLNFEAFASSDWSFGDSSETDAPPWVRSGQQFKELIGALRICGNSACSA